MDRRTLLILAACIPALSTSRAKACSVALKSVRSTGLENEQVEKLFQAWWERDAAKFRGYFTNTLMADGSPMDSKLANTIRSYDSIPANAYDIFDQFFTDKRKLSHITLIVNTQAGIIVACSEEWVPERPSADCSSLPDLHLFLIKMSTLNPRSITHLATVATPEVDKFGIWTAGSL